MKIRNSRTTKASYETKALTVVHKKLVTEKKKIQKEIDLQFPPPLAWHCNQQSRQTPKQPLSHKKTNRSDFLLFIHPEDSKASLRNPKPLRTRILVRTNQHLNA